jgi:hypothetical protein
MLATLALALALQAPTNVPRDAEVIYALMPRAVPVPNADGSKVDLAQSIHSVTATLASKEAKFESLSLYKNTTGVEGKVEVVVAFESWRSGFGSAIKVEALWSDQPVVPTGPVRVLQSYPEKGQVGTYAMTFSLQVKKQATHSLRLRFTLPTGVSGVDREERLVAYRVADIKQAGTLDQFRMAVKYTPEIVFAPIESKPDWGWQVGSDGAYLKLDGKRADRDAVLTFRYYPPAY